MHHYFTSNETSSWLLYILTDSALPTGGFVSSSGLEASHQAGLISNDTLPAFVQSSAHNYASNTVCFVKAGYEATDHENTLEYLIESDNTCNAVMASNAVARRASLAQGIAMLTLFVKCFATSEVKQNKINLSIVKTWKNMIRMEQVDGHFAVCFGLICRYLDVDEDNTLHLWLYLFTRTIYSSAVRLNVVGPYEAQKLLLQSRGPVEEIIEKTKHMNIEDCCQTNPLLDICQGMHDRLYSRLFNS
ncbi:hypothetical protein BDB01DRAFT_139572 [Pilobolus umbonatus]|nr:hypothetical protein BDB01DRAFT_139572 [Pilobolus umbonatus]